VADSATEDFFSDLKLVSTLARVLIIGFGSIGQRHERLLASVGHQTAVVSHQRGLPVATYESIHDGLARHEPNYVVVASPTARHSEDFRALRKAGFSGHILIEKPLFLNSEQCPDIDTRRVFVGYNTRFFAVVRQLSQLLGSSQVLQASFHNAQYLPDWRPGRDYRSTSSARRSLGGGVLRDLSHEIDLLHFFMGIPRRASSTLSRLGNLEIDTEDTVNVQFEFGDGRCAQLYLSYLDRIPRRRVFLRTAHMTIDADLLTGSLSVNENHSSCRTDRDVSFLDMHRDVLSGGGSAATFKQGLEVLRTIDLIEADTTIFESQNV